MGWAILDHSFPTPYSRRMVPAGRPEWRTQALALKQFDIAMFSSSSSCVVRASPEGSILEFEYAGKKSSYGHH